MRSIPEKESFTVEFLSDREKLSDSKLLDEVVGLANTFGGNIYVGIEDDGEITDVRNHISVFQCLYGQCKSAHTGNKHSQCCSHHGDKNGNAISPQDSFSTMYK